LLRLLLLLLLLRLLLLLLLLLLLVLLGPLWLRGPADPIKTIMLHKIPIAT